MISIFTYNFKSAEENFKKNKFQVISLSDFDTLIKVALEKSYITEDHFEQLKEWHKDPEGWSEKAKNK